MERKMRRFGQQLSDGATVEVLRRNTCGVLALSGDDGYPYAVPLCYVYDQGRILFHGANEGHKIDAMRACDKASFCVIDREEVIPEKYTTLYRSVIAFGRVRILTDDAERLAAADALGAKYRPGFEEERKREIDAAFRRTCLFALEIDRVTGKESMAFVNERKGNPSL